MNWLEIIEINYGENKPKLIENDLETLIKKFNKKKDQQVIQVYSRVSEEIDFSIHLHHESDSLEKNGSSLGISLSNELKEFAMIQHKVWV